MTGEIIQNRNITLVDVAAEAGVSAITVSRVLRTPAKVSPQTRARVEAAVTKLGYVPDPAASALASRRTDVIALLVPSLTNNVFGDVLRGIYDQVTETPFSVQIGNYRYAPSSEERLIRTFLRQKPAGMIVAGIDQTDIAAGLLRQAPCPVVQIMDYGPAPVDMSVGFSHEDAARAAAEHLIAKGYRRPAFLGARMDPRSQKRLAGFRGVMQAAGLFDPARVVTTPQRSSIGMGGQLLADLFATAPDTDAIFCNNDDLAAGALFEAQRRHLRVPEDLGICGFNDFEISRHLNPGLTSVAAPLYQIGTAALDMVLRAIDGDRPAVSQVDLGAQVVARGSTAR